MDTCNCENALTAAEVRGALTEPMLSKEKFYRLMSTKVGKLVIGGVGTFVLYRLVVPPKGGGLAPQRPQDFDQPRKPFQ